MKKDITKDISIHTLPNNDSFIKLQIYVDLDEVLYHIKRNLYDKSVSVKDIKNFMLNEPYKLKQYLLMCQDIATGLCEDSLDEYTNIQEFSEEIEEDIKKFKIAIESKEKIKQKIKHIEQNKHCFGKKSKI